MNPPLYQEAGFLYDGRVELLLTITFIFFAAVLASFLQVVIVRTAREQSFIIGRSACDHCQRQLAWYDNLPLLSFLWLRGRCRSCGRQINRWFFVSEVLAAMWALSLSYALLQTDYLVAWTPLQVAVLFGMGLLLLFIVLADLQALLVPDVFSALLLVLVLVELWARVGFATGLWLTALATGGLALGLLWGIYRLASWLLGRTAMGLGDVKLVLPLGISLGWPWLLLQLFLAFVLGGLFAILLLLIGKKRFGQALPFAPFLVIAFVLTKVWGAAIWAWYIGLII